MTTGKTVPLTRRTFVGKVMSLLLNMLSRLVITFLPRSKCLLISWLQSPSAVIVEPPEIKWLSGKQSACRCRSHRRPGLHPWAGKIPWRRKWHPTPVLLPGESHGQRSLVGYSPWGHKELDTSEQLNALSFPGGWRDTRGQDSLPLSPLLPS